MKIIARLSAAAVGLLALAGAAFAQVPSSQPPYNVDTGALLTNANRVPGTYNSAAQTNLDKTGVVCTAQQTAVSGTPSWSFAIQGFDAATNSWNTLATSSTISTSTTAVYTAYVQSGLIAADVPTNGVGKSVRLPRVWRVQEVLAGSGVPGTTSKVGCNLFK